VYAIAMAKNNNVNKIIKKSIWILSSSQGMSGAAAVMQRPTI
jgi:hypothetical protein